MENNLKKANHSFKEQQAVDEEQNIQTDEDEPVDIWSNSQTKANKLPMLLLMFEQNLSFSLENSLQLKCKLQSAFKKF